MLKKDSRSCMHPAILRPGSCGIYSGIRLHEAIAGSELAIIEGAAHVSNLDAEAEFTRRLSGFLERSV
jgi:pimeloyl-ACP methyl ester carboxylesterase